MIAHVLERIMRSLEWPLVYKQALLKAILKDLNEETFRPISLLPCLSKVHESFIANLLKEDVRKRQILSDAQFGGRPNSSTEDVVMHTILDVSKSIDQGQHVLILYINIAKAFDRIDHSVMMEVLKDYKVPSKLTQLIDSYLKERSYFIKSAGGVFKPIKSEHGGPQVSVLLPLLWSLHINPLVDASHCSD